MNVTFAKFEIIIAICFLLFTLGSVVHVGYLFW